MKSCRVEDCGRRHSARGLCGTHYRKAYRNGILDEPDLFDRLRGPAGHESKTPTVVLDYLLTYDRPLTADVLAAVIRDRFPDVDDETVRRALYRLRDRGLVRSYRNPFEEMGRKDGGLVWRLTPEGERYFDPETLDNMLEAV